jgi:hypothetical protein
VHLCWLVRVVRGAQLCHQARSTQHHDRRTALFNTQLNEEPVTTSLDWPCVDHLGAARLHTINSVLILSLHDRQTEEWIPARTTSPKTNLALKRGTLSASARSAGRHPRGGARAGKISRLHRWVRVQPSSAVWVCVCVCAQPLSHVPRHVFVVSHTLSPSLFPPPLVTPMLISSTATASTAAASTPAWLMATRFGFYSSDLHQHTPPHRWLTHSVAGTCPSTTRV